MSIPGVSGSVTLMVLGQYNKVYGAVSECTDMLKHLARGNFAEAGEASKSIWLVLVFAVGGIAGFILISKLIARLLAKYEAQTYYGVAGMVIGAVIILFLQGVMTDQEFTAAFGGGRRDEEKSRAKERIFSFRNSAQAWDPKNQRPEMWKLYNTKIQKGESMRVFPISNWTEKDIWQYIQRENIEIVPLYFAKERPVIYRDGNIIMVDDDRLKLRPGEKIENKKVRFRTLGCYPLTGGIESEADTLDEIIDETLSAVSSERTSRVIDHEAAGSMERRKREGYF